MQAYSKLSYMEEIVETLRKDRKQTYTLTDITQANIMPWARNMRTLRRILDADACGPNLLKAEITGDASQRRYTVPKRALIKYLQTHGPSLMALARKPKQPYAKEKRSAKKAHASKKSSS